MTKKEIQTKLNQFEKNYLKHKFHLIYDKIFLLIDRFVCTLLKKKTKFSLDISNS